MHMHMHILTGFICKYMGYKVTLEKCTFSSLEKHRRPTTSHMHMLMQDAHAHAHVYVHMHMHMHMHCACACADVCA